MSRSEPLTREEIQDLDRDELEELYLELQDEVAENTSRIEQLEAQIGDPVDSVEAIEKRLIGVEKKGKDIRAAIAGTPHDFDVLDLDQIDPLRDLLLDLAEEVEDHEDRLQMVPTDDGKASTPDERAIRLRQVLLNRTKGTNDDVEGLSRSACSIALSGDLHKGSVLDAMRRAADGREADIDGSSKLDPVDAITFERGGTVGSSGEAQQSIVKINRSRLTDTEGRQILTTGDGGERG